MTQELKAALTAERDALKTQVAILTAGQEKAATQAEEKQEHAELLAAALSDGRIAPVQKPWAEKQSLSTLTLYLDAVADLPKYSQHRVLQLQRSPLES